MLRGNSSHIPIRPVDALDRIMLRLQSGGPAKSSTIKSNAPSMSREGMWQSKHSASCHRYCDSAPRMLRRDSIHRQRQGSSLSRRPVERYVLPAFSTGNSVGFAAIEACGKAVHRARRGNAKDFLKGVAFVVVGAIVRSGEVQAMGFGAAHVVGRQFQPLHVHGVHAGAAAQSMLFGSDSGRNLVPLKAPSGMAGTSSI